MITWFGRGESLTEKLGVSREIMWSVGGLVAGT